MSTEPDDGAQEFDCAECERHIIQFGGLANEFCLCATCVMLPGWFNDPELRGILEPDWADE